MGGIVPSLLRRPSRRSRDGGVPSGRLAATRAAVLTATLAVPLALPALLFAQENRTPGSGGADGRTGESAEEAGAEPGAEPGLFGRMEDFVDDTQRQASDRLLGFINSVDGFFGSGVESVEDNKSWARIRIQASKPGDEDLSFDGTVKLRVVLPQSEQRFRLLLSSEDEEEGSAVSGEDTVTPEPIDDGNRENVSLALRFVRTARENSSLNFDVGVRQREGAVQTFGRVKAVAEGEMVRHWTGSVSNNYYYYSKSGFENRLSFNVYRPIIRSHNFFFQTTTGFDWRKGRKGASIGETLGLYAELNERTAIAFEALAGYSTSLNGAQSARYGGTEIRIRWRQNVWRSWFSYEIWPSVSWPSSNDYEQVYGGLLRIEAIIGRRS